MSRAYGLVGWLAGWQGAFTTYRTTQSILAPAFRDCQFGVNLGYGKLQKEECTHAIMIPIRPFLPLYILVKVRT